MIIKVRCWDEEAETMFYSNQSYDDHFFEFNDKGVFKCWRIDESSGTLEEPPEPYSTELDNDPELFTGLTDKNRKEIFEGDIDSISRVVEYKIAMSGFYLMKNGVGSHLCHSQNVLDLRIKHLEIIGNIHENPELL